MEKYIREDLGKLWHVYDEALRSNCFIYHKAEKAWFTPEEFRGIYEGRNMTVRQVIRLMEELVIRDPIAGINAGHKQINEEIERHQKKIESDLLKLFEFNRKVIAYYQSKIPAKR